MLTIFGNLLINSEIKLQHLKDSFLSFNNISDDWIINIRGKYREEAVLFLKKNLEDKLTLFQLLDDKHGWSKNSVKMLKKAKYNYILTWNEDHLNIAPQNIYPALLKELENNNIDYMMYTWYNHHKTLDSIGFKNLEYVETATIKLEAWEEIIKSTYGPYLITTTGIFKKNLLSKLLHEDTLFLPYFLRRIVLITISIFQPIVKNKIISYSSVNKRLFKGRLPKFSKEYPHNLEKEPCRTDYLPLVIARPKQELFVCIDDDNMFKDSCLIKRGLYPSHLNTHPNKL
jgi:hypothetical protein